MQRSFHKKLAPPATHNCQILQCNLVTAFKYLQNTFSTARLRQSQGTADKKHLVQFCVRHETELNRQRNSGSDPLEILLEVQQLLGALQKAKEDASNLTKPSSS